jgi:WD40 repeat protein
MHLCPFCGQQFQPTAQSSGDAEFVSFGLVQINDMSWNPFHPWMLATGASDGALRLWKLPEHGLTGDISADQAAANLMGHGKRVDNLAWHPAAVNVLASTGSDNTVRIWDASTVQDKLKLDDIWKDQIDSISWNYDGSSLAVASRDKKLRIVDPRSKTASAVRRVPVTFVLEARR